MKDAIAFECADCGGVFFVPADYGEPPDYCFECEQEIRETGERRYRGPEREGGDLEPVLDLGTAALQRIHALYQEVKHLLFRPDGYVYLLGGGGYYKIGRSRNVSRRMRQLEIQLPWPVEVLHTIPCEDHHASEKALHERFAGKRANGEWFALDDEDVEWIKGVTRMIGRRYVRWEP